MDGATEGLARTIADRLGRGERDLHIGRVLAAHRDEPRGSIDARNGEQLPVGTLADEDGDVALPRLRDPWSSGVVFDRNDLFASVGERERESCAGVAETADDRVAAGEAQPVPAE